MQKERAREVGGMADQEGGGVMRGIKEVWKATDEMAAR